MSYNKIKNYREFEQLIGHLSESCFYCSYTIGSYVIGNKLKTNKVHCKKEDGEVSEYSMCDFFKAMEEKIEEGIMSESGVNIFTRIKVFIKSKWDKKDNNKTTKEFKKTQRDTIGGYTSHYRQQMDSGKYSSEGE